MKTIETVLKEGINELKSIIIGAERRLENVPKGYLRISKKKNKVEYYYKNDEEEITTENGRYMKKSERDLAKNIAQRDYDISILKKANERLKAIEIFLDKYKKTNLKEIYSRMHQCRRELIQAVAISDEEFVRQWQDVEYKGKDFVDNEQEILTERGERVRSKSEKIIADKLFWLGIPYRYEFPIMLEGNIKIYPDFTILRMPMREEVYLEHFGMMDDADYVNTSVYKLNTYEKNGIYLGVNLFVTHETSRNALNTKALDAMLRELFCEK
jgi:hypothetical protein